MAHSGHRITDVGVQNEYTTAIDALVTTILIRLQSVYRHPRHGLENFDAVKMTQSRQSSVHTSAETTAILQLNTDAILCYLAQTFSINASNRGSTLRRASRSNGAKSFRKKYASVPSAKYSCGVVIA